MKNSDDAIGTVLAGLRDTEAPEGMERRILDALEHGTVVHAESVWHRLLPLWLLAPTGAMTRVLVGGAVFASVVVVVFATSAIRHAGDTVRLKKEIVAAKVLPAASSVVDVPLVAVSPSHEERAGLRVRTSVTEKPAARTVDSEDSVALSEMRAASFPAPPMPLTEQEKLLLRIAHRGDPVEMAMLDPSQRSLQEMKEKAEYQSFFARPVIKQPTVEQGAAEEATPTADSASDPAEVEEQQQMLSGEDNKNGNDNSKSNGKKKGETE